MYHSGTSPSIQEHVLQSLRDPIGKVRVTIATNALGMGVDIKGLYNVIHYGPPSDLEFYMQEMGRAGRDGKYAKALLLFHGRQLRQCKPEMLDYVKSNSCHRRRLLIYLKVKAKELSLRKNIFAVMFVLLNVNVRKTAHKTMEVCFQRFLFQMVVMMYQR